MRVQPAAPMVLVSERETSKTAPKHGRLLPVQGAFQKTLASKAKAAGASSRRGQKRIHDESGAHESARRTSERAPIQMECRLPASSPAAGQKVSRLRPTAPASGIGAVVQAQAAKLILNPGEAAEAAEGGHTSKKKTAAQTAKHTDGLATLPGLPGPAPTVAGPGTLPGNEGETVRVAAALSCGCSKSAEIKVHVVDARKKTMDSPAPSDDSSSGVKGPAPSSVEKNTSLPGAARNGTETVVQEPRRQSHSCAYRFRRRPGEASRNGGLGAGQGGSIVLRDGGGEIKLVLKPESLGSVRIRMNLVDNAIEGQDHRRQFRGEAGVRREHRCAACARSRRRGSRPVPCGVRGRAERGQRRRQEPGRRAAVPRVSGPGVRQERPGRGEPQPGRSPGEPVRVGGVRIGGIWRYGHIALSTPQEQAQGHREVDAFNKSLN